MTGPDNSRDDEEDAESRALLAPMTTMPGRNGGTLMRGKLTDAQKRDRSPKRIREAARKMLLAKNTGGLVFIRELLMNGSNADKKWATEQLLKHGVGAANVSLDNEGNAMANTLNIIEREEGVTGGDREDDV